MSKIPRDKKGKIDNDRRLTLLAKREASSLSKEESKELDSLQKRFETWLDKEYPPSNWHIKKMEAFLRKLAKKKKKQ